jgi:methionyl-tRNA formyltransferase
LRLVFAGTPAFAIPALEALASSGHEVVLVLTQPDRPAGRGMRLTPSAVAQAATRLALAIAKPASLREPDIQRQLRNARVDAMVVAAYGLILPRAVLEIPPRGCLNIHASLLPRWRGAAPIQRALLAGDASTGVCIMQMEAGLDTGPVLLERSLPIGPRDTTGTLTEKLSVLGASAIVETLARLDTLKPHPQDPALATYAAKIDKAEARLDWQRPTLELDRCIRAFNPAPGAEAELAGVRLKIWEAEPVGDPALKPGSMLRKGRSELYVGCSDGALRLLRVQRPGGRNMTAGELLQGDPWATTGGENITN